MKKIGIIVSGYRKKNTYALVESYKKGAEEAGHEVKELFLKSFDLRPCTGCESCYTTGKCVIKDEMHNFYDLIDESDILVLASPIYFYMFTSDMKLLFDRAQPYWSMKDAAGGKQEKKKELIYISTNGQPYQMDAYHATFKPIRMFCGSILAKYKGNYLVSNTDRNPVKERIDLLEEIFEIGKSSENLISFEKHY
ncbi:flavodoxin family protein [Gallicola sp. Sow4_E12]|uniref:flavodoxin family protein n=1 Tax=Gallicola sp. Sow4_E12 TaxID=3438785 RepID=UPI003F8E9FD4